MGDHLHNNAQATPYLRALNSGLNQLLSQPATAETGQQILDEFKRFFRCPHTYRADNEPFRSSLFTAIEQAEAVDKNAAQLSTALR